jgi:hypothetical protein
VILRLDLEVRLSVGFSFHSGYARAVLDALARAVETNETVIQRTIALLTAIKAELDAAIHNPPALLALSHALSTPSLAASLAHPGTQS